VKEPSSHTAMTARTWLRGMLRIRTSIRKNNAEGQIILFLCGPPSA
jgi:hypothetical protein